MKLPLQKAVPACSAVVRRYWPSFAINKKLFNKKIAASPTCIPVGHCWMLSARCLGGLLVGLCERHLIGQLGLACKRMPQSISELEEYADIPPHF